MLTPRDASQPPIKKVSLAGFGQMGAVAAAARAVTGGAIAKAAVDTNGFRFGQLRLRGHLGRFGARHARQGFGLGVAFPFGRRVGRRELLADFLQEQGVAGFAPRGIRVFPEEGQVGHEAKDGKEEGGCQIIHRF